MYIRRYDNIDVIVHVFTMRHDTSISQEFQRQEHRRDAGALHYPARLDVASTTPDRSLQRGCLVNVSATPEEARDYFPEATHTIQA